MLKRVMTFLSISICVFIFSLATVDAQFPTNGVVGYWSFDAGTINGKNVKDLLGKNDGELDGNPKVIPGIVGGCVKFLHKFQFGSTCDISREMVSFPNIIIVF